MIEFQSSRLVSLWREGNWLMEGPLYCLTRSCLQRPNIWHHLCAWDGHEQYLQPVTRQAGSCQRPHLLFLRLGGICSKYTARELETSRYNGWQILINLPQDSLYKASCESRPVHTTLVALPPCAISHVRQTLCFLCDYRIRSTELFLCCSERTLLCS